MAQPRAGRGRAFAQPRVGDGRAMDQREVKRQKRHNFILGYEFHVMTFR